MAWFWTLPEKWKGLPFATYGGELSRIPSYKTIGTEVINQESAEDIVLLLTQKTRSSILGFHCIPNDNRCPLVDAFLERIIIEFAGDDAQVMPVVIKAKDSEVTGYSFVRPLIRKGCVDIEKSEIIDWAIPGEKIWNATSLALYEDCLDGKHFVRDSYTNYIIVSDGLKDALMATGDKGLFFRRPEDTYV